MEWDAMPPFLRLRDRWMEASYPQSYAAWDDEQVRRGAAGRITSVTDITDCCPCRHKHMADD